LDLTDAERREVGFVGDTLVLEAERRGAFTNRSGRFTVEEVAAHVVEFERARRPLTTWCGGVDCHHTFFEGLRRNAEGDAFHVAWAS
jgi:hypothetical protein